MSESYISKALRRAVSERAGGCCEYCLTDTDGRGIDPAIDHIISEKHGGQTLSDNLCLSCFWCNSYKGSDISSVDWEGGGTIIGLFHPRQQHWDEHFTLDGLRIVPKTPTGRVTVFLLQLNAPERIKERRMLRELGVYPCQKA
ncbi:MAG: HNH endonuclease [Phototrophicaceae bacterium]|jgi:hypothetical protein